MSVEVVNETVNEKQPTITLGEKTFHELNIEKDEWGVVRDVNKVYVNTSNENKTDKLQFSFDPFKKWFHFGKVKQKEDSSTDSGEESYYNIYLKPYIVTGEGSVVEEGSGGGEVENPTLNPNSYLTSIGKGFGILIDKTIPQSPIVSVDSSIIPTDTKINSLIDEKISKLNINGDYSGLNVKDVEYMALLELLQVMKVQYEDEPIMSYESASDYKQFTDRVTNGFRFVWSENETSFNCLRIKQNETNDGEIYLKIIDGGLISDDGLDVDELPFGKNGDSINTVSINKVQQNSDGWDEWYFPKNILLKHKHIYIVIPHHDKNYTEGVTDTNSVLKIQTTNDYNSAFVKETGVWTSDRTNDVITCTPIFQICYKNPTTITMIR